MAFYNWQPVVSKDNLIYFWKRIKQKLDNKVEIVEGKGLSTNDYTTAEKDKLAGIASGATNVVVDEALNASSTNAIANSAVAGALDDLSSRVGETSVGDQIAAYAAHKSHTHNYAGSRSIAGPARSAEKLSTARQITLSGAVSGTASFDGSANVEMETAFPDDITVAGTITANKVIGAVYM